MLVLLFKQPLNIWRTLELRHKIEAFLLFVLIFAFMATRFTKLFSSWLNDGATDIGIALLVSNLFTLLMASSSVLILRWLVPKQKALNILISRPLDSQHIRQVLLYYALKYLSVYIILFLPVASALFFNLGLYPVLLSLAIFFIINYFFLLISFQLQNQFKSGMLFIFSGFFISAIYHGLFAAFYWWTSYAPLFQIIILFISFFAIIYLSRFSKKILLLENYLNYTKKEISKPKMERTKITKVVRIFPDTIQALFEKEILSLWRNTYYRKLKIYSYLIFIFISLLIITADIEHKEIWLVIITCIIIWLHYSNNFNAKYVVADPEWFIRTLPIRFRHLFFAKYFAEIAFVLILLLSDVFFLQFTEASLLIQFYHLIFIFVFAHVVLFTMLNFQIMFFDNTRLAAYAYHFALLFIVIMILNYRLVGPIIALGLLIFFMYKNVKYFNN